MSADITAYWTALERKTRIDFEGQSLVKKGATYTLTLFTVLGFLLGYFQNDIRYPWLTMGAGFLICLLIFVPPWPIFNQHPIKWRASAKAD